MEQTILLIIDSSGGNFSPNSWLFESKMVNKNPNFYFVLKSVEAVDRRGYNDENAELLRGFFAGVICVCVINMFWKFAPSCQLGSCELSCLLNTDYVV